VHPVVTTKYRLDVKNLFGAVAAEVDVNVPANQSVAIGQSVADASAGCDDKSVWVTAVAPPVSWDSHLTVGDITSLDPRAYHVEHAGLSGDLPAGARSDAFKGTPVTGAWKLVAALAAGEKCGTPSAPRTLGINVFSACNP
jgi:hypothetical protein